jgi:LemA protein
MPSALWIAVGVAAVLILFAIFAYNRLVSLREQVRSGWAQVDVLLKRRHDLIPNLVETVKGYAAHEKGTLENVIAARNTAVAARGNPDLRSQAEGALGGTLRGLFALAENYPDLKADANFLQLQGALADAEDQISGRRQQYNAAVASYNAALLSFPSNLVAGPFGFAPQPFFEIENPAEREVPAVKF